MIDNKNRNNELSSLTRGQGKVDYMIVGQGLCGTLLSWYLHKEGKSFLVIDDEANDSSSKVAAGIINPVTGRRYVASWMTEELIPFAKNAYEELGAYLDTKLIFQKDIIDFFPSPQMRDAFVNRVLEETGYLHSYPDQNHFNTDFNYDFGCGMISPVFMIQIQLLLAAWKNKLLDLHAFLNEKFDQAQLRIEKDTVSYKGIEAQKIIFCEGIDSMNNQWFGLLPFSAVKGEVLIIQSNELMNEHIFKKGLMLAPLGVENTYWVGSSYQWTFEDNAPTEAFLMKTTTLLNQWLKVPYTVLFHKAAVRPATLERRPFIGFHPKYPNLGILNGMGTKGTSLAPFFAHQLVQNLVHGLPFMNEVNINRFNRILSAT